MSGQRRWRSEVIIMVGSRKTVSPAGGYPAIKDNRLTGGESSQDRRVNFMTVRDEKMMERKRREPNTTC